MNFDIKTEQVSEDAYVISLAGEVDLPDGVLAEPFLDDEIVGIAAPNTLKLRRGKIAGEDLAGETLLGVATELAYVVDEDSVVAEQAPHEELQVERLDGARLDGAEPLIEPRPPLVGDPVELLGPTSRAAAAPRRAGCAPAPRRARSRSRRA